MKKMVLVGMIFLIINISIVFYGYMKLRPIINLAGQTIEVERVVVEALETIRHFKEFPYDVTTDGKGKLDTLINQGRGAINEFTGM